MQEPFLSTIRIQDWCLGDKSHKNDSQKSKKNIAKIAKAKIKLNSNHYFNNTKN